MNSSKGNHKAPARAEEKSKIPFNPALSHGARKGNTAASREGTIKDSKPRPRLIVGMGASSGGSAPLLEIAKALKPGLGIAAVAIMHIEPVGGKNPAFSALSGVSAFGVVEAAEGMDIEADRLYVVPPGKYLGLVDGKFVLQDICVCKGMRLPIDYFFCSLALHQGFRCAGILFSGKDADGTLGLSEIKAAGGRTIVQDPAEAQAPDMPKSAIAAGVVDLVLPFTVIADALISWAGLIVKNTIPPDEAASLRGVLALLRLRAGHDFRCYKHGTLLRRIERRKTITGAKNLTGYLSFLLENEEEINRLRSDLLIGVTDFFRQPDAWRFLKEKILPSLVEKAGATHPIRAWVPACASGKEAYTLAMLLAEVLETSGKKAAIQIFATDTDEPALAIARSGIYSEADVKSVPAALLRKYFSRKGGHFQVVKKIREAVVFAPQNLTSDPPFSRLDLVSCRNLLIYLDHAVQKKIIAMFHFSLRMGGFLFLGNAETAAGNENLFETVSKKWRMYRRIGSGRPAGLELPMRTPSEVPSGRFAVAEPSRRNSLAFLAQQALLERFAPPAAIIDRKSQLLFSHGAIDRYITVARGESSLDMVEMAREGLRARLRGAIANVVSTNRAVSFSSRVKAGTKVSPVKVTVAPLRAPLAADGLLLVIFEDVRQSPPRPQTEPASAETGVRQLEDELKVTRVELQSTIEQLEASSEEQKASNEEVMAANEELQSTNEELETSKEELQSLNEELNTVNNRLQEKVDELEGTNNDITNLLTSSTLATLFLDRDLKVKRFTPAVTGLLSLIDSDLGRPITDVVRKFTDDKLVSDAKKVLANLHALHHEVVSETGQWFIRRITPYRTQDDRIEGVVVTFSDVTELKKSEKELRKLAEELWTVARLPSENPNPILRINKQGVVLYANDASGPILRMWGSKSGEAIPDPWRKMVVETFADQAQRIEDMECGKRTYNFALVPIFDAGYVNLYGRDITERKRAEEKLGETQRQNEFLADIIETSSQPFAVGYPDGRLGLSNKAFEQLTGYTGDELRSIDWATVLTPPQWVNSERKKLEELNATGLPVRYEKEYTRKDGTRIPVELLVHLAKDTDDKPQYYYSFLTDISERKEADKKIAFQSHMLENMHDAAIGLDSDFVINYWNESAERMYGWTAMEAIGRRSVDLFNTVAMSSTLKEMTSRIKSAGQGSFEVIHHTKDGRELFVEVHSSAITDQDGNPTEFISVCRDITERKRAEEVLAFHARLLSEVSDAVFSSDSNYSITYWNQAAESMFGWTKEEVLGKNSGELLKPEVENSSRDQERSKLRSAGRWDGEVHYIRKDGTYLLVEVNSTVLRDVNGKDVGNVVVARDITERKRAEEALRLSEERYRTLFNSLIEGFCIVEMVFDDAGKPVDYRFLEINEAFEEQTGLHGAQGKLMRELEPGHEQHWFDIYGKIATTGEPAQFVNEAKALNRWFEVNAFRMGGDTSRKVAICFNDITRRKKAEIALQEGEQRLKFHFENSPLAVVEWDSDFIVTQWSREAERIFGWKKEETLGKRIDALNMIYTDDIPIVNKTMERLSGGRETMVVSSNRNFTKSGAVIECTWYNSVLLDPNGKMSSVMSLVQDITERGRAEKELYQSEEKFRRIVETANEGITMASPDGVLSFVNKKMADMFGYSVEEMVGKRGPDFLCPDQKEKVFANRASLAKNGPVQDEFCFLRKNRSTMWTLSSITPIFDEKGDHMGNLGMHADITERKSAEEKVLRAAEELRRNNEDLARFNRAAVNRELRMIEMKREVNDLCQKLGQPIRYDSELVKGE
jgi:two-component system, chemotaxis family, CheB/CheR fusion protein